MAKTKPYGVRFDIDLLETLKEDGLAATPQKAVNFLTEFYRTNREKIDFKKMFEESNLFKNTKHTSNEDTNVLDKALKKSFSKSPTNLLKVINETPKEIVEMVDKGMDMMEKISELEKELASLTGTSLLAKQRRKFVESKISELKRQLK